MTATPEHYSQRLAYRHRLGLVFEWACRLAAWGSVVILAVMLVAVTARAWHWLDWQFLTSPNDYDPERAGILGGFWGSFWLIGLTGLLTVPVGVGAALYLEEYAKPNWMTRQIQLNIANLAGVPSVVYGILGYSVFIRCFGLFDRPQTYELDLGFTAIRFHLPLGTVVLSGALTLCLLSLPVVIIASQEALRAVPASLRHASLALGATKWQTIRHQILPASLPGIMTGVILALSRALGETAPLAVLGAASHVDFVPGRIRGAGDLVAHPGKLLQAPFDGFTAIPLQIYTWVNNNSRDLRDSVSAAGIVVLLVVLIAMNGLAIYLRQRYQQKIRW